MGHEVGCKQHSYHLHSWRHLGPNRDPGSPESGAGDDLSLMLHMHNGGVPIWHSR
jgi:hypothetical protein